jgi:hypothetical protein
LTRALVASRRRVAVSASSPLGKGAARVAWRRPRAPRRRVGVAGAPPPRFSAVRRPALSSPPLEDAVVFAGRAPSSWCRPRVEWCTPAPFPCRAAARRRSAASPRAVAGHAPPPAACSSSGPPDPRSAVQISWTPRSNQPLPVNPRPVPALDLGHRISIQRIRSVPSP